MIELLKRMDFSKLSARERVLFGLTAGAVLLAYLNFFLKPMIRSARELASQEISLKTEIDQGMSEIPLLRKRADDLNQTLQDKRARSGLSGKGPEIFQGGSRLSDLLEEVTRLARLREIEFVSVRPEAIEDKGSYFQFTLQIDLQSRFRELGDYLLMLENLPRAVAVEQLKIETRADLTPSVIAHLKTLTYLGKE